ncbi:transporter substrate-binding domain-containing protein [Brachybacterium sp. JHP9]|uniref:Transporter substrate-binding domain-containing protein n=1 Tax=Brachybacterium equifaecis TaxID=2910770 RepID=A0ABT0R1U9_9MICO|nr:transporter substrate-binding domain-containing protein [Brachybacterium equifaecis]MCL6423881.1 transporter substrate-binding domain-containing protein [Brachybacterium equifaecis]
MPSAPARGAALALLLALLASGCGLPRDADGALERASGGTLVVGIAENPPSTEIHDDGSVSGEEVDLVQEYARSIDAQVEWVPGGEGELARQMRAGDLDLLIGGLAADSSLEGDIALTRPYAVAPGPDGEEIEHVLGVRSGENALLVSVETHLASRSGEL